MTIRKKNIDTFVAVFFAAVVAVVFQQIFTSMTEQGIASGSPYDNGAAYPKIVTILIAIMVLIQSIKSFISKSENQDNDKVVEIADLKKPFFLLCIFAIYLALLGFLGYHLTTAPMIFAVMTLCGMSFTFRTALIAVLIAFVHAYAFEVFLKVVLPGGIFGLNIPW